MTKIQPVEQCGAVRKCMTSPQSYRSQVPSYLTAPSNKRVAAFALQKLEEAWKQDQAVHEKNAEALEANQAVRDRIQALMDEVGMPKTRRVRDGNRMRYGVPKMKTVDAGYLDDFKSHVPIGDGFLMAEETYNRLKADYDKFAEEAEKEAEKEAQAVARAAEAERQARRDNLELAKIILRYGLDEDSAWGDVLGELRKKDQRLDLAVAMMQTRSDWSDGFYRVSDALNRFKIDNDTDKDIANEVVGCMNDDDGRVFRDCSWSYDRLFAEAKDKQLSSDIQMAASKSERDY